MGYNLSPIRDEVQKFTQGSCKTQNDNKCGHWWIANYYKNTSVHIILWALSYSVCRAPKWPQYSSMWLKDDKYNRNIIPPFRYPPFAIGEISVL